MKIFFKLLTLAFFISILNSCTDVVQIKLDEGSKLYVIDAFVNDLRISQTIKVVTNDSYFSNRDAPAVPNANVVLTDLTGNIQYNFNYTSNGNYVYNLSPADTIAKTNHQYKLDVTIDGVVYTSMATQKRSAIIDSISSLPNDGGGFGPPSKNSTFFCLLNARDIADNNPDYYWIKTFRNDTLFNGSADINVCIDGTGGIVTDAPNNTVEFTPPAIFLGFKQYKKLDICKVEIHSTSRETYFFFVQALGQITNGGLFATTPENVKTNITTPSGAKTKAVGWFNMATVAVQTKVVK